MQRYGARCGWAHCLLFAAELPQFRTLLPDELQREMEAFKAEEKQQKAPNPNPDPNPNPKPNPNPNPNPNPSPSPNPNPNP